MTLTYRFSLGLDFDALFIKEHNSNQKKLFQLFPFKYLKDQILPHHLTIIYIEFNGITPQMLHSKFQGNKLTGSGKEDFSSVLPHLGTDAILVM